MKQRYSQVFLLVMLLIPGITLAGIIKGKVTDTNGEPLPFATVYIQGTANGTSASANAEYQLHLNPGTYKITCQYMGYRQSFFNVTVKGEETIEHDFLLNEQTMEMKTVVIKANAEDPAYAIIRKAIARRQFHLDQVRSFQSDIYLKGVFRNRKLPGKLFGIKINDEDKSEMASENGLDSAGKGVLYLCEEEAYYYSKGDKERTIIKSVRESGSPNGLGISTVPSVVTFYENNVQPLGGVSPRGFVSPISDNALHYYKYKLEGEFLEDGYMVYKIKVIPKREYEPLMQGTIYIVDNDWAIHSLNLFATTKYNLELLDTLKVEQTHLQLGKDKWVIKSQVLYPTFKLFGFDVAGYFVTVYENQKINGTIPDSIFGDKIVGSYEKNANKKDTAYWTDKRPIPLEQDESRNYVFKDSIRIVTSSPEYVDSVRRVGNKPNVQAILMTGYTYNAARYRNTYTINGVILGMLNYNTVEGLNVAPKISTSHFIDSARSIKGATAFRYGFSNERFNAITKYYYEKKATDWHGRYWRAGFQGGRYVFQYNPRSNVTPLYNTVTTLFQGKNYMKIYERLDAALLFERNYGNGLQWNARLNFQKRTPLANTANYTFDDKDSLNLTSNYPAPLQWLTWEQHNAALVKISISYQPGYTYTQYPDYIAARGSDMPTFNFTYEKGIPGIFDSKTDFDKWRFSIRHDFSMKLLGSISYDIAAGGFFNKKYVSQPDLMHIADNQVLLAAPYLSSFQLAPYYLYSNNNNLYGELHVEYYLKGLLTNKIPILRQAKWYLVLGTNTLYTGDATYYTEAFAGITNLGFKMYRFLRVDFVYGRDHLNVEYTGIRLGLDLSTLGTTAIFKTSNDDW